MKHLLVSFILCVAFAAVALANPCVDPGAHVVSVPIAVATAGTTQLLAPVTNASYTLCGFSFSISGSSATAEFEYGTGSTCGTGTTAITGAYSTSQDYNGYFGEGLASNGICLVTAGTPAVNGHLSYVLNPR